MKKLVLFLILAPVVFSCTKPTDSFKPIDIQVDLIDDVSPLVGAFSIPGEYDHIEWTFEEKYSQLSENPAWHIFINQGKTTVRVTAYRNETHEKFSGMKEIDVPGIAKKLKITGLFFKNLQGKNPLDQKSLSIAISYGISKTNKAKVLSFSPSSFSPSDTLFFPEPIIYDIEGFLDSGENEDMLYLSIIARQNTSIAFHSITHLKGDYMGAHPWCPDWIQCSNRITNDFKVIYLLTDYMLE